MSTHEIMREFEEQLTALENSHGPDSPPGAPRPQPQPQSPAPYAPLPVGTAPMLEAQLGEALKAMRDFADWVHHPHAGIGDCIRVGDAMGRLMTASATLATVSARLQKGEPETRHRMIVEYAQPQEGVGKKSKTNKP